MSRKIIDIPRNCTEIAARAIALTLEKPDELQAGAVIRGGSLSMYMYLWNYAPTPQTPTLLESGEGES